MEEVKSSLHSRELRFKASATEEVNGEGLFVSNSAKNGKKKKDKGKKKIKFNPKDICNYCKEPGHWNKDCPKKKNQKSVAATIQEGNKEDALKQVEFETTSTTTQNKELNDEDSEKSQEEQDEVD
ncbi:Zinc finger, CCHC-type, partial [Sesbania bispinosa]